eukprot:3061388-Amphidinium_carterae.2
MHCIVRANSTEFSAHLHQRSESLRLDSLFSHFMLMLLRCFCLAAQSSRWTAQGSWMCNRTSPVDLRIAHKK